MPPLCSVSLRPIGKEVSQDSGVEVYMREVWRQTGSLQRRNTDTCIQRDINNCPQIHIQRNKHTCTQRHKHRHT